MSFSCQTTAITSVCWFFAWNYSSLVFTPLSPQNGSVAQRLSCQTVSCFPSSPNYCLCTNSGYIHTHAHTHTRLTALCPGLPRWAGTRKVKPIWILLKQETVSGSDISWAICKSAPHTTQITMPASTPPLSFYRPDALPAAHNQQRQSTEGYINSGYINLENCIVALMMY